MAWLGAPYAALGLAQSFRDELGVSIPRLADYIPQLTLPWWIALGLAILLVVAIEGAYRKHQSDKANAGADLRDERTKIATLQAEIAGLRAGGPKVIMSTNGLGIQINVETRKEDAFNVRLVPISRDNYILRSDVITNLLTGSPAVLILRCGYKDDDGSPIFRKLLTPLAFFAGQSAVSLELAYSDISGVRHYRSTFLVQWDEFNQSISDIKLTSTGTDTPVPKT